MSAGGPNSVDAAATRDWEAIRASSDIQFAPMPPVKPPETPAWLEWLSKALRAVFGPVAEWLVAAWPWVQKGLIVLAVLLVAFLAWRLLGPLVARWRGRAPAQDAWTPSREEALALLEDADRLAAQGRFGEAAHLLLLRSVGQIRARRPGTLVPASTAREIASLPQLPQAARTAFAVIAERVERCLFGLRDLDLGDWQAARAAYSDFALADLRA
ncbi:hypothetical protein [Novosphingobium sp. 9U]|uniref:hypothetical protein n=1 Tax=Novosphingobium sp. 9U TaxID=2653158 RepID=UPI0012F212F7|nr:hypothetical protein [Novosphingobium sp. 9U]VWX53459.1 conserved hypothetical protein [Novosphingobium sp. 9U]